MPQDPARRSDSVDPVIARFRIGANGGAPLYRQIADQLRALVAGGRLRPGQAAPSVRALAAHLKVSPMTVSKAYGLLARAGMLEHEPGLGMFVPRGRWMATASDDRLTLIEPSLRHVVDQAARLRLRPERVLERVAELLADDEAARDSTNAGSLRRSGHVKRATPARRS